MLATLERAGIRGGATYDGLIGSVAVAFGATLVTCDERAMPIYERLDVTVELVI